MNRNQMIAWLTIEGWHHMTPMDYSDGLHYYVRTSSVGTYTMDADWKTSIRECPFVYSDEPDASWDLMPDDILGGLIRKLQNEP